MMTNVRRFPSGVQKGNVDLEESLSSWQGSIARAEVASAVAEDRLHPVEDKRDDRCIERPRTDIPAGLLITDLPAQAVLGAREGNESPEARPPETRNRFVVITAHRPVDLAPDGEQRGVQQVSQRHVTRSVVCRSPLFLNSDPFRSPNMRSFTTISRATATARPTSSFMSSSLCTAADLLTSSSDSGRQ